MMKILLAAPNVTVRVVVEPLRSDGRVDGVGHEVEWGSNPNRGSAQWEEDEEKK